MPKVDLTATYGYLDPVAHVRTYYGPGTDIEVPQGLIDTLGLTVKPEPETAEPAQAEPEASDLPADFPGRRYLVQEGHTTLAGVSELSIDQLIEIKGIGTRLAEQILERVG